MKIKTLLFGAGEGSEQFIINEQKSRTFLAYVDNNEKRYNTKFNDLQIISPKDIENFDYDEIVITTQWAREVKKQLLNELKIDENKIIVPKKSLLKKPQPFQNQHHHPIKLHHHLLQCQAVFQNQHKVVYYFLWLLLKNF